MKHHTVFILGHGGLAKEIQEYVEISWVYGVNKRPKVIFVDIADPEAGNIIRPESYYNITRESEDFSSIIGSGKMSIRIKMSEEIKGPSAKVIHKDSTVSLNSNLAEGVVIAPLVVISSGSKISEHVLINYGATIGHDAIIGRLSVVGPNASIGGNVIIGDEVYIGSGVNIKEEITIGYNSIIAMGAVVVKDVPPRHIAIGCPAKIVPLSIWRKNESSS